MKRITIFALLIISFLAMESQSAGAQVWSVKKAEKWYRQQGWLVGANYSPAYAINQLEFWQAETFDPEIIDKELGWAEGIGMNCMRVYLHHLAWRQDKEGFKKRVSEYLTIAAKHKIKTVIVLFDDCWNPVYNSGKQPEPEPGIHNSGWIKDPGQRWYDGAAEIESTIKEYTLDILMSFKNDKRILMWDLYNEPGWSGKMDKAYELSDKVFNWARKVRPSQPLSICVWNDEKAFEKLNALALSRSDVISYHNYEKPEVHLKQILELKKVGRPLVCTEYMARKRGSTFSGILPMLKKEGVIAINWGLVDGKTQTKYAWDEKDWGSREPALWFHDIFRADGSAYDEKEVSLVKKLTGKKK